MHLLHALAAEVVLFLKPQYHLPVMLRLNLLASDEESLPLSRHTSRVEEHGCFPIRQSAQREKAALE
jgi:hypothetical protein